jgi:hypothetical protein
MKVDRYTKFVLTYIAVCLTFLSLKESGVIPNAYAQQRPIPVYIDQGRPVPVAVCWGNRCADVRPVDNGVDALMVAVPSK